MMEEVPLTRSWPGAHGDGAAWVWMERPLHPGVRLSCGSAPGGKSVGKRASHARGNTTPSPLCTSVGSPVTVGWRMTPPLTG